MSDKRKEEATKRQGEVQEEIAEATGDERMMAEGMEAQANPRTEENPR